MIDLIAPTPHSYRPRHISMPTKEELGLLRNPHFDQTMLDKRGEWRDCSDEGYVGANICK